MKKREIVRRGARIAFCVAVAVCVVFGCKGGLRREATVGNEQARITSPSGQLDAVLVRDDGGGAAGGWEWYIYIVAKGSPVDQANDHAIFNAGTLTDGKIVWRQEHLLEIHYAMAYINQFRNIWGTSEIHKGESTGEGE